ncbi:hypothetical protein N7536_009046 [Penicillium majusculum]|nr:hypothetical protein N7536_009046 [Penicillium majusculum]
MDNTEPYICTSCPAGPRKFSTEYDLRLHFTGSESGWKSRRAYHLVSAHKCGEWDETNKVDRDDHSRQRPRHGRSGTNGPRVKYSGNACRKEKQDPDQVATTTPQVPDEGASYEAHGVSSKKTYRRINKRTTRSEHSADSRASQQSTPSTGSQVSDESIQAGHSVFHAMDDLVEEHLKEVFPKPGLMSSKKTMPANESYKTAVRSLLHECHENLVVLYDDMKLAFNSLKSRVLVAQGSEEAYTELTLQISEFSYRLDQCLGLEPDEADTGYASTQEEDRTWSSQLTYDKNKYMGSKKSFKTTLSGNKPRKSLKASFLSAWRRWSKSMPAGPAAPEIDTPLFCDCCPQEPKKFDHLDDLRAHEMVKRYSCPFCDHRFRNKDEAERHQNSLHLRQYSWSCATLMTFTAAFSASISPSCQTNADWDRRFEHLTTIHKFSKCNNMKKFYRVDHFRQHLKYTHTGTRGEWTNILETACMKEEQPVEPQSDSADASAGASSGSTSLTHSPVPS